MICPDFAERRSAKSERSFSSLRSSLVETILIFTVLDSCDAAILYL